MELYYIYQYIFIGGLVLAIVMAAISLALFFVFGIPKIIGDLSGRNAKKAIENIRSGNEASGQKTYKSSHVNSERGKLTDKISASGKLQQKTTSDLKVGAMATSKIGQAGNSPADETTVLGAQANETTVLGATAEETTVLGAPIAETTVLSSPAPQYGETMVLDGGYNPNIATVSAIEPSVFQVVQSIMYIHTDEVII